MAKAKAKRERQNSTKYKNFQYFLNTIEKLYKRFVVDGREPEDPMWLDNDRRFPALHDAVAETWAELTGDDKSWMPNSPVCIQQHWKEYYRRLLAGTADRPWPKQAYHDFKFMTDAVGYVHDDWEVRGKKPGAEKWANDTRWARYEMMDAVIEEWSYRSGVSATLFPFHSDRVAAWWVAYRKLGKAPKAKNRALRTPRPPKRVREQL